MLARMSFFFGGDRRDENRGGGLFMLIVAPIAAMLIQMAIRVRASSPPTGLPRNTLELLAD